MLGASKTYRKIKNPDAPFVKLNSLSVVSPLVLIEPSNVKFSSLHPSTDDVKLTLEK